ncbi:nuclear pore complex protein Nup88 [Phlebotomus argentipes]|uniref:nuclear pore complex protein Nup88 n=1 Tax=Phlebotomus argentipes TaxID=94469 RepID=UPI0028931059|nr:nuclear pore complex protein Nup88 [Phlebotomus argentipes]
MATCTDTFQFNSEEMFKLLQRCLPDDLTRTQNLIEACDDILFAWNSQDNHLLTLNWRAARSKGGSVKFQTLIPSASLPFTVNRIAPSVDGNFVAVSGNRGVALLELPRRWGTNGLYRGDGKENIICRIHILDDRLFTNNTHLEVLQVKWHPGSPTGSHLIVLLSDNSLRVYHEDILKHVWRVGPMPRMGVSNGSTLPSLSDLGDTAVDFDIAPPRVSPLVPLGDGTASESSILSVSSQMRQKVEWPIVILRGNGNIYTLCAGLNTKKPKLQGPLTITPPNSDNYGHSSCSVLIIPSLPPCVVISESIGRIHHALLLEVDEEEAGQDAFDLVDLSIALSPSEWRLQVLETVELELGLPQNAESKSHFCPIQLRRDLATESRYFAYHNTGVHAIFLEFLKQLHDFAEAPDEECAEPCVANVSRAEYILCTKALNVSQVNPVLGFTLLQSPAGLAVLLGSGQVVSLNLITDPNVLIDLSRETKQRSAQSGDAVSPQKKYFADSIESRIVAILKAGLSQPLLKLNKSAEPTPQELLELLMHATQTLREQYFPRHEKCRQELKKRVEILQVLHRQQLEEIQELRMEKKRIRDNAENLAGKYEDMYERQQSLFRRAQEVARLVTLLAPSTLADEKEFAQQVEQISVATKQLAKQLEAAKGKMNKNQQQIEVWEKQNDEKKLTLPPKREEVLKKILGDMKSEINNQVMEIKQLNRMLDM